MQALHAHSPFVPAQNNSTFSLSVVLHMAMESRIFMLMGGYHGPSKPMHEFILSSSQLSNQDTYTTTSGRQHNISKPRSSNTPCSSVPPFQLIRKPTKSPLTSYLSASHNSHGPPSPPPGRFGPTLAPGHSPSPIHLAHLRHPDHRRTNHTLGELPPPFNATPRNAPALTPHKSDQLLLHPIAKALQPNAPGNLE